jgi:polyferredoxin
VDEQEKVAFPDFDHVVIGPNEEGFIDSLWLGIVMGLLYAPLSFWRILKEPMADLITGSIKLVMGLGIWVLARLTFLTLGFAGLVRRRPKEV